MKDKLPITRKQVVYVAGPYTADPEYWTEQAMVAGMSLMDQGYACIIPHLFYFLENSDPSRIRDYDFWMEVDYALLSRCDMLAVITEGESKGRDSELVLAKELGLPIIEITVRNGRAIVDNIWKAKQE